MKARIDYKKLENILGEGLDRIIVAKVMYLGIIEPIKPEKQAFIDSLESEGWAIIKIPVKINPKGNWKQKGIDIKIFKHGIQFAQENVVDKVILVSGDSDFAELVITLKELGKKIEIWSFKRSLSHILVEEAGEENIFYLDDILEKIIKI